MANPTPSVLIASLLYLALPSPALAQNQPQPSPIEWSATSPSDEYLRSIRDRPVVLLVDGLEITARILAVDFEKVIITTGPSEPFTTLPRASVTRVRLLPPTRARQRHVGLNLSITPGVEVDLDAGLFHGFANVGVSLPLATMGAIVPFSLGFGMGCPTSSSLPALKLDVFAHLNVVGDIFGNNNDFGPGNGNWVSFGVGLGLHYTWGNGFTMGFTVPLMGYSVIVGGTGPSSQPDVLTGMLYYLLTSAESLPLAQFGYRF